MALSLDSIRSPIRSDSIQFVPCNRDCSGEIYHLWNALRAHSSVWLAILFTLCVCNLLISDRSMPQNQYIIFPQLRNVFICADFEQNECVFSIFKINILAFTSKTCPVVHFFFLVLQNLLLHYFRTEMYEKNVPSREKSERKKIIGNKLKMNARCVNKNLGWIKYCTLHGIDWESLYWKFAWAELCRGGGIHERSFGVVLVIIIMLLHACRWMWVI